MLAGPGNPARVLLGRYEPQQSALFERTLKPGDTVFDVGAHAGYYTLLASRLVGPEGHVFAFEPNPRNLACLRRHVRLNRCDNVTVVEAAVARHTGAMRFDTSRGSGRGRLCADGAAEVATVSLDQFAEERGIVPSLIKIDVEGSEVEVLEGARRLLAGCPPLVLSVHHGLGRACSALLLPLGYAMHKIGGGERFYYRETAELQAELGGDAEGDAVRSHASLSEPQ